MPNHRSSQSSAIAAALAVVGLGSLAYFSLRDSDTVPLDQAVLPPTRGSLNEDSSLVPEVASLETSESSDTVRMNGEGRRDLSAHLLLPPVDFIKVITVATSFNDSDLAYFLGENLLAEGALEKFDNFVQDKQIPPLSQWAGVINHDRERLYAFEVYYHASAFAVNSTNSRVELDPRRLSALGRDAFESIPRMVATILSSVDPLEKEKQDLLGFTKVGVDVTTENDTTTLARINIEIERRASLANMLVKSYFKILELHSSDHNLVEVVGDLLNCYVVRTSTLIASGEREFGVPFEERLYAEVLLKLASLGQVGGDIRKVASSILVHQADSILNYDENGKISERSMFPRDQFWTAVLSQSLGLLYDAPRGGVLTLLPEPTGTIKGFAEFHAAAKTDSNVVGHLRARRKARIQDFKKTGAGMPEDPEYVEFEKKLKELIAPLKQ